MKVSLVTGPTQDPITLDQAKEFLKIDMEDDDGLITSQVRAATEYAEGIQGRRYITQTWKYYLDAWPEEDYIELPYPPLQSVSSLIYTDYNGTATTFTSYTVDAVSEPGRIVLNYGVTWPIVTLGVNNPIAITFTCGYGTPDDVPEMAKNAIKLILDDLYENREVVILGQSVNRLDSIERLLMMDRVFHFK